MKLDGSTALITGASAGIGREFARQLAPRASKMVLVARRTARLEELRDELVKQHPKLEVHVCPTDLSKHKSVSQLCECLAEKGIAPDLLINNAGVGDRGSFATSDFGRVNDMMQVNVVSLTLLTRKLLPAMIAAKRGAILNVSSSASFLPIPGMGVYAATKAYVTSFSEALRTEVRGCGITVVALCPGPVHTEFDTVAKRPSEPKDDAPEFTYVPTEVVVRNALLGLERGRALVIPGVAMKVAMSLVRLTPMPLLRLAGRFAP
ncbi:MAG TPA: SDR family oxidoreductase [Chthoniobacterales bacterium]|nr:SDR family oxidoreductase [Chthoniobacterales bacterium]